MMSEQQKFVDMTEGQVFTHKGKKFRKIKDSAINIATGLELAEDLLDLFLVLVIADALLDDSLDHVAESPAVEHHESPTYESSSYESSDYDSGDSDSGD